MGNQRKNVLLLIIIMMVGACSLSLAAQDYSPNEAGARASGMGGAFVARADDTSALFYNPAGLAFLKGLRFKGNLLYIKPCLTASWPPSGTSYSNNNDKFNGSLALSWKFINRITAGFGFFMPYHFLTDWPFDWRGSPVSLKASLNSSFIRPAISVEIMKGLALGAGLDFVSVKTSWRHTLPFNIRNYPLPEDLPVHSIYDLRGTGMGFTAGILWKALPSIQFGAKYQHHVSIDLTGSDSFIFSKLTYLDTLIPDPILSARRVNDLVDMFYRQQSVRGRVTLPKEITGGVLFTPSPRLSLQLDLQWNSWTEMGKWAFRSVNSDEMLNPPFTSLYQDFYGIKPGYGVQSAGLAMKDSWRIKGGVEYVPARCFALRAGFMHRQSSTSASRFNPLNPDQDQNVISLGFGYEGPFTSITTGLELGLISFDAFFRYGFSKKSTSTLPGYEMAYQAKPWTVGIGIGAIF